MTKNKNKDKLLESANTYLQMGKLLKVKRNDWAKNEVEKILSKNISDEQKVTEIQRIDLLVNQQKKILKKKKDKIPDPIKETSPQKTEKSEPVAKKITKENIIFFLLFQYKKIAKFGKETQTLKPNLWRLNFQMSPQVGTSLYQIQNMIQEIMDPLQYLIETSWINLNKEEYNLIVAFKEFCEQYYKEFLQEFDYTDLVLVQKHFFIVTQKESYRDLLIQSIRVGLVSHRVYSSKVDEITNKVKKIIDEQEMKPSLTNIIMALHMKDLKRFFRLKDLVYTEEPPAIKRNKYNAPDDVLTKIQLYIRDQQRFFNEKEHIYRYNEFVLTELFDNKQPDFEILKKFSPFSVGDEDIDFTQEKKDLYQFVLGLLKEYSKVFRQFTLEKIPVTNNEGKLVEERIIPFKLDNYFREIVEQYRFLNDAMKEKAISTISFDRYQEFIEQRSAPKEDEKDLFFTLDKLNELFYEVSIKLFEIYGFELELNELPTDERLKIMREDKDIFEKTIPFAKARLNLNYYLSNKSVMKAFYNLMEFCINFALFFLNQDLIDRLRSQPKLREEVTKLNLLIQRMK